MRFEDLNICAPILKAIREEGYSTPTPIQEQAVPIILEGRDLVGCAQTGTGKTAAFAVPILQILHKRHNEQRMNNEQRMYKIKRMIKALILTPTRELAVQTGDSLDAYGRYTGLKHAIVYGGVSQIPQTEALIYGIDILVATPGRLLDLIGQGFIALGNIEFFVLDEADRMLDMGFSHDVKKIIGMLPEKRQTLLFSATMPPEITRLVDSITVEPVKIAVTPISSPVEAIEQAVYFVEKRDKKHLLAYLLKDKSIESALIFTRTKHGADKITRDLAKAGIQAKAIHGDKSQTARQQALNSFKAKQTRILVATDIAARGIDIEELTHVINYDLPNISETYVHRIGRTGRAGLGGVALSFCDVEEKDYLKDIEKLISRKIPVIEDHPFLPGTSVPILPIKPLLTNKQAVQPRFKPGFKKTGRK